MGHIVDEDVAVDVCDDDVKDAIDVTEYTDIPEQNVDEFDVVDVCVVSCVFHAPFVYVVGSDVCRPASFCYDGEYACAASAVEHPLVLEVGGDKFCHNHLCCLVSSVAECHVLVYGDADGRRSRKPVGFGTCGVIYDASVTDAYGVEDLFLVFRIPVLLFHLL